MKNILILLAVCLLFSCSKEKLSTENKKTITLNCYSTNPKFLLQYVYGDNMLYRDTIYQSNYSISYDVYEENMEYSIIMKSLINTLYDSLYIKASYDGKEVSSHFTAKYGGNIELLIQPSEAK